MLNDTASSVGHDEKPFRGLTTREARERLARYGPNAVAQERPSFILALLGKFWAPVPWMLEATIILELVLGKNLEAGIIAALLAFNALLSLLQENRAQGALLLLKRRLAVRARVLRDGAWRMLAAEELVPGDYVHLRMGDLVPADVHLDEGQILLDQSALTGESMPVETGPNGIAHAGAIVRRGEASGEVVATGAHTAFGKTAELVRSAKTVSHLESIIFTIVKYLVAMDGALVLLLIGYSQAVGMRLWDVLPFALILLVASVPVALPATFTLATALGSLELARHGVLTTRLSAIEEAAAMDLLCSDKTGTITKNQLALADLRVYEPFSEDELLRIAAAASDEATQDPLDLAILARAHERNLLSAPSERVKLIPFDPATKLAEAVLLRDSAQVRVLKGAPRAIAARVAGGPAIDADVERLAANGYRVLAVASGPDNGLRMAGLLAFEDPPREDSAELVQRLRGLGVRVVMVTGDAPETARAIAARVGIGERVCPAETLRAGIDGDGHDYDVFAGVFPEDKFNLVRRLQKRGHVVGMTGDGVNDAPALKQAEVGIAVANATDVAKAAASLVLTNAGLTDLLAAVETSRRIYQRTLTYTLNKIVKTFQIALFLTLGVILTRIFIITPLLIVLLLFANDFVTMSISTDQVSFSQTPDRWHIGSLMGVGLVIGVMVLIVSFALFILGRDWLALPIAQLQTLVFLTLVFTGQGTVYLVRERRHFWNSAPSRWLLLSSIADISVVSAMAARGILMAPLGWTVIGLLLGSCAVYLAALDFLKVFALKRFKYVA
jgi:H+-transporting ATPase